MAPPLSYGFLKPLELLAFGLVILGLSIFPVNIYWAVGAGVILLILVTAVFLSSVSFFSEIQKERLYSWLSLILFGLLCAGAIAVGRVGFGINKAMLSRYIIASNIVLVSTSLPVYVLWRRVIRKSLWFLLAVSLITTNLVIGFGYWQDMSAMSAELQQGLACLQTYKKSSEGCLEKLGHSAISGEDVRKAAPVLNKLGAFKEWRVPINVFYNESPGREHGKFQTDLNLIKKSWVNFQGWAFLDNCDVPEHIVITFGEDNNFLAHTKPVLKREHGKIDCRKNAVYSGWAVSVGGQRLSRALDSRLIRAWAYDPKRNSLILLPNGPPFVDP